MYTHFLWTKRAEKLNDNLMKKFKNYGFYDISYGNDCCNSVAYNLNEELYFQVFLPNSFLDNHENEQFNTFHINLQNPEKYYNNLFESNNIEFNTIEEVLGFIFSNKSIKGV